MIGETIPIAAVQLREIKTDKKTLYIYGWVDYNDIFKDTARHRTEYCVRITVPGEPELPSVSNIHFLMHREHNGMDEECMREAMTTVPRRQFIRSQSHRNKMRHSALTARLPTYSNLPQ